MGNLEVAMELSRLQRRALVSLAKLYCRLFHVQVFRPVPNYLRIAQLERAIGWHLTALTCVYCGRVNMTAGNDDICVCQFCDASLDVSRLAPINYIDGMPVYMAGWREHELEGLTYSFSRAAIRAREVKRLAANGGVAQPLSALEDELMLDGWEALVFRRRIAEEQENKHGRRSSNRT